MNTIVSRCEFKYLLKPAQVPEIRRFLLRYCIPDLHARGGEWYGIQSLYLDTGDYRFYRAAAEKALERLKLRVRAYSAGTGPVKLEIKRRSGDLVRKRSLILPRETWERLAPQGVAGLARQDAIATSDFLRLVERFEARPRVLVEYQRQAFHSTVDEYVRVTFDRRMRCQPMRAWSVEGNPRAWRLIDEGGPPAEPESPLVLELKFHLRPPAWLRDLVTSFGLARRGFSKYCRSVRHTVADREPAWDLHTARYAPNFAWRVA